MEQRKTINYLKAFAIILVVVYHACNLTGVSYMSMPSIRFSYALRTIHVPLFILIAGYLCHRQPLRSFYGKKIRRILVPFLLMSALNLLLNNILPTGYSHGSSLLSQLADAFVCGQLYWFCYCLLIMFALAPLLWDRKLLKALLLILLIGIDLFLGIREIHLTDWLQLHNVLYDLPYSLLGMLFRELHFPGKFSTAGQKDKGTSRKYRMLLSAAALLIGGICGYMIFYRLVIFFYILDLLFGLSVMTLMYLLASFLGGLPFTLRFLDAAGRYSFQIMLLDPFFHAALYRLLSLFLQEGAVMVLLIAVPDLALSYLLCKGLEKIPVLSGLLGLDLVQKN